MQTQDGNKISKETSNSWFNRWSVCAGVALVVLAVIVLALFSFRDNIFRWSINPRVPFQTYAPPPEPDYSLQSSWAAFPEKEPEGAWESPWGVDVFFIHPSSYYAREHWNAPIDDPEAVERLETSILPNHASPFLTAGPVYAPRYRQAALLSELNFGEDSLRALMLAYEDVEAAFDLYLAEHNRGRAIILAGMGQGGLHAQRLLMNKFTDQHLAERLVGAYLIDTTLPVDLFDGPLSHLAPCHGPLEINCIVAWRTVADGEKTLLEQHRTRSKSWTDSGKLTANSGRRLLCVNPLLWSTAGDFAPKRIHRGGVRATGLRMSDTPAILPAAVSAQCVDGVLVTDRPGESQLRQNIGLGADFKTPEFSLFFADIEFNVKQRAEATVEWLERNAAKPAPPLPPVQSIEITPIVPVQDSTVNPSSALRGREEKESAN